MSDIIYESGLCFSCPKDRTFHIEKSSLYRSMGSGIRTVESIIQGKRNAIIFVEAKLSSPRPDNYVDFDSFIAKIVEKFSHSIDICFSLALNRISDTACELPACLRSADYAKSDIILLLVINNHPIEWLPPITNELRSKLRRHIKTWRLKLTVINHEQAKEQGLLVL